MPNTDFPKFTAAQIADLIKQADTKATATFYVLGITTAALLTRLTAIKTAGGITMEWMSLFTIAIVLILLAFKSIIAVIYPRFSKGERNDLVYFENIVLEQKEDYVARGMQLEEKEIAEAMYRNVYNLALIAHRKYHALRIALGLTGISIIATIVILFLS